MYFIKIIYIDEKAREILDVRYHLTSVIDEQ